MNPVFRCRTHRERLQLVTNGLHMPRCTHEVAALVHAHGFVAQRALPQAGDLVGDVKVASSFTRLIRGDRRQRRLPDNVFDRLAAVRVATGQTNLDIQLFAEWETGHLETKRYGLGY